MAVARYTCTACGLVVRTEQGMAHVACACKVPYAEELEAEEA